MRRKRDFQPCQCPRTFRTNEAILPWKRRFLANASSRPGWHHLGSSGCSGSLQKAVADPALGLCWIHQGRNDLASVASRKPAAEPASSKSPPLKRLRSSWTTYKGESLGNTRITLIASPMAVRCYDTLPILPPGQSHLILGENLKKVLQGAGFPARAEAFAAEAV